MKYTHARSSAVANYQNFMDRLDHLDQASTGGGLVLSILTKCLDHAWTTLDHHHLPPPGSPNAKTKR